MCFFPISRCNHRFHSMGCFCESLYGEIWRHVQIYEECRREATEKRTEGVSFEKRYLNMCNFLHLLKATVGGDGNTNRQTLLFTSLFAFSQVLDPLLLMLLFTCGEASRSISDAFLTLLTLLDNS